MKKTLLIILSVLLTILSIGAGIYYHTHPTHWKYNDNKILGKTPQDIVDKYGMFDMSAGQQNDKTKIWWAAYYCEGPKHEDLSWTYYFIYFENGVANVVEKSKTGYYPEAAREMNDFPQWTKNVKAE